MRFLKTVCWICAFLGKGMKYPTAMLVATLLLADAGASHAVVRITNDRGGQIGRYVDRYEKLRAAGQAIIIDGLCASACTIVLGTIPYNKICVTPKAELAFHGAWDFGFRGRAIPNPEATKDPFFNVSNAGLTLDHQSRGLVSAHDLSAR